MVGIQIETLAAAALSGLVGLVALRMAWKGLFAEQWLPFHRAAAGVEWESLPAGARRVLVFLVRMGGLGFLAPSLLLVGVPVLLLRGTGRSGVLAILGVGVVYSAGLGLLTRRLHRDTGASAPWKASFGAAAALALALFLLVASSG